MEDQNEAQLPAQAPTAQTPPAQAPFADTPAQKLYALVSHESAVEAIWALASRDWEGILNNEDIWLIPPAEMCVATQGDFAQLASDVDLDALGIRSRPVHLLVPNKACYSRGKSAKFHVWGGFFPTRSFVRVHKRVFVSTPYFAALQIAMACKASRISREEATESAAEEARLRRELGIEGKGSTAEELLRWGNIARMVRAIQVMCDFMGTYRYVPDEVPDDQDCAASTAWSHVIFDTVPLVTPKKLKKYLEEMKAARGIERARQVASMAFAGAASPMESMLAIILTLPVDMGGFGLPRPVLNRETTVEPEKRDLSSQNEIIADLCWPDDHLIVEYYGWKEHFGAGPRKVASDAARANSLVLLGWTVLHVTFEQLKSLDGIALLARQIAAALHVSLPEPSELELIWRSRLMAALLPPVAQ